MKKLTLTKLGEDLNDLLNVYQGHNNIDFKQLNKHNQLIAQMGMIVDCVYTETCIFDDFSEFINNLVMGMFGIIQPAYNEIVCMMLMEGLAKGYIITIDI